MNGRSLGLAAAILAVVAGSIAIVALVASVGDDTTAFVDLEPGACFDLPSADDEADTVELLAVDEVDCTDPHDAEVVAVGDLGGGDDPYPGFEVVDRLAAERCALVDVDRSELGVVPVAPTEPTWDDYDGRYVCIALRLGGGQLEGSVVDPAPLAG